MGDPHQIALATPVFVAPFNKVRGTHQPGLAQGYCTADAKKKRAACPGPHTGDWRAPLGSPENVHRIEPVLVRARLEEVLDTHYRTEAHFASYMLTRDGESFPAQPRIQKGALPWLRAEGFEVVTTLLFADWDTPGHVPWTPDLLAPFHALWARGEGPFATCGVYLSPKGVRVVQPLRAPLPVEQAEASLRTWLDQLIAAGADPSVAAVHDWTRLMRTPHHRREGGQLVVSPFQDLSRMVPAEAPAGAPVRRAPRRRANVRAAAGGGSVVPLFVEEVPEDWRPVADALGAAIRAHVRADWRRCYLALSGALCARGCPLEAVPAVVGRAHAVDRSYPEWEELLEGRIEIARRTAVLYASGEPVLGHEVLAAEFPALAATLDATTTDGLEAGVMAQLRRPGPARVSVADALAVIRREIAQAYGVVCIAAPPGTGKTRAIVEHSDGLPAVGHRAAAGSRIALGVPRHDLALQVAGQRPERVLRLFSPVAHVGADGRPSCIYVEAARSFASGGQSIRREFCEGRGKEPCSERDRCPAYAGREGPENANLVVGPHGLVRELRGYAGAAGTLVVDEPGEVVFSERVTLDQLATAQRYLDQFADGYAAAMGPALAAFTTWLSERAEITGEPEYVQSAIHRCAVDGDEVLQAVAGAVDPKARTHAPPLRWSAVAIARSNPARAHELGEASRVLSLLWRAVTRPAPYAAVLDEASGERAATVVGLSDELLLALRHEGPVVILDADVALHLPAIEKVLGHRPRLVELDVRDGAPIQRTVLVARATRSHWMPRGVPRWEVIVPALRAAVGWILEDPSTRRVGVIAPKTLEAAIGLTLDPASPAHREAWSRTGLGAKALEAARAHLAPVLGAFTGQIVTGHYQALEGLDFMADCDATITLGDARPNLGDQQARAAYLGLALDDRLNDLAAAEQGQAHGRLRTIHRTRDGRQLHVGAVVPRGWEGYPVDVRRLPAGRPPTTPAMSGEDFRRARETAGLSQAALAKALRCSAGAVKHYEAGRAPVPSDVATALVALATVGSETPFREIPLRGVSDPTGGDDPLRGFLIHPAKGVSDPTGGDDPSGGGSPKRRARRINLGALLGGGGGQAPGPVACASNDTFPRAGGAGGGRW